MGDSELSAAERRAARIRAKVLARQEDRLAMVSGAKSSFEVTQPSQDPPLSDKLGKAQSRRAAFKQKLRAQRSSSERDGPKETASVDKGGEDPLGFMQSVRVLPTKAESARQRYKSKSRTEATKVQTLLQQARQDAEALETSKASLRSTGTGPIALQAMATPFAAFLALLFFVGVAWGAVNPHCAMAPESAPSNVPEHVRLMRSLKDELDKSSFAIELQLDPDREFEGPFFPEPNSEGQGLRDAFLAVSEPPVLLAYMLVRSLAWLLLSTVRTPEAKPGSASLGVLGQVGAVMMNIPGWFAEGLTVCFALLLGAMLGVLLFSRTEKMD